jgi:hypothetical protein
MQRKGYTMSESHRKLITSNCKDCGCEIHHRPSKQTIRCRKCAYNFKRSQIDVKCSYCGEIFKRTISKLNNSRHKFHFCNRKCKENAQSLAGNCPNIRPSHYGDSQGKHFWKILINDVTRCASCNETRKYLFEVHHKDSDRENNVKENLEIVCCNCHNKRHLKIDESGEWVYDSKSLTPRDMIDKL